MKLTINEIARIAQVSKGTVSKVINNYPGIHEKTREKVAGIIKQMGYEPNYSAQSLALKKTGTIGLIIPHSPENSISGAYWSSLVTAVTQEATQHGYNLSLLLPKREGALEELFTSIVRKRQIDGLIIGAELLDTHCLSILLYNELPFVMLGKNPDFSHYCVDIDNVAAARRLTSLMVERGYRKIAFIVGPEEFYYNRDRVEGYRDAIKASGLEFSYYSYERYNESEHTAALIRKAIEELAPDSLISGAGGDFMFDCLRGVMDAGKKPPAFGFATFDDYRYLDFTSPGITAVAQPMAKLGEESLKLLIRVIKGQGPKELSHILEASIVERDSTRR
jgi:LacI family transcriptional regulator